MVFMSGKRDDFYLAMSCARLIHQLLQATGRRVVNPLFAALRANGRLHTPHHYYPAPQIRRERGLASRLISAA
jgi:hypothetical protein